ncbi:hypothetical protein AAMO2058_000163500 [Amorphochlora amoebiformis]
MSDISPDEKKAILVSQLLAMGFKEGQIRQVVCVEGVKEPSEAVEKLTTMQVTEPDEEKALNKAISESIISVSQPEKNAIGVLTEMSDEQFQKDIDKAILGSLARPRVREEKDKYPHKRAPGLPPMLRSSGRSQMYNSIIQVLFYTSKRLRQAIATFPAEFPLHTDHDVLDLREKSTPPPTRLKKRKLSNNDEKVYVASSASQFKFSTSPDKQMPLFTNQVVLRNPTTTSEGINKPTPRLAKDMNRKETPDSFVVTPKKKRGKNRERMRLAVRFASELQRLFSFLHGTKRVHVSSSRSLKALRNHDAALDDTNSFSAIFTSLISCLRGAFEEEKHVHDINALFASQAVDYTYKIGETLPSNVSKPLKFHLDLKADFAGSLHEALETLRETEIEQLDVDSGENTRMRRSRWFNSFPELLFIHITRSNNKDNAERGRGTRKGVEGHTLLVRKRFHFPQRVHLDRYLYKNKEEGVRYYEEHRRLRRLRAQNQREFRKFAQYHPSSDKEGQNPVALDDVLEAIIALLKETKRFGISPPAKNRLQVMLKLYEKSLKKTRREMKRIRVEDKKLRTKMENAFKDIENEDPYYLKAAILNEPNPDSLQGESTPFVYHPEPLGPTPEDEKGKQKNEKPKGSWFRFHDMVTREDLFKYLIDHPECKVQCLIYGKGPSADGTWPGTKFDAEVERDNTQLEQPRQDVKDLAIVIRDEPKSQADAPALPPKIDMKDGKEEGSGDPPAGEKNGGDSNVAVVTQDVDKEEKSSKKAEAIKFLLAMGFNEKSVRKVVDTDGETNVQRAVEKLTSMPVDPSRPLTKEQENIERAKMESLRDAKKEKECVTTLTKMPEKKRGVSHQFRADLQLAKDLSLQDLTGMDGNEAMPLFRREKGLPAGLRNVNNICSFNSLVQVLYNAHPDLREAVLTFPAQNKSAINPNPVLDTEEKERRLGVKLSTSSESKEHVLESNRIASESKPSEPKSDIAEPSGQEANGHKPKSKSTEGNSEVKVGLNGDGKKGGEEEEKKKEREKVEAAIDFVRQLQRTFVFLARTIRRCHDPRAAVMALLRFHNGLRMGEQHDITEIFQIVVDAMALAFKEKEHGEDVIKRLFQGSAEEQISGNGIKDKLPTQNVPTGHLIVNVDDENLHAGLEAQTKSQLDDSYKQVHKIEGDATKTTWFTKVPEILFIQIQRTRFDPVKQRAIKINKQFRFQPTLHVDRYLQSKKKKGIAARKRRRELLIQKQSYETRLREYTHFRPRKDNNPDDTAWREQKCAVDSKQENRELSSLEIGMDRVVSKAIAFLNTQSKSPDIEGAIRYSQEILENIHGKMKRLRDHIRNLNKEIKCVFSPIETSRPYELRAVMVHEGYHASGGHYWAYVRPDESTKSNKHRITEQGEAKNWLKFNDSSVSWETEDVVFKESYGGHLNASAYCLIYTCPRDTQSKNYTKTKTIFDIDVDRDNEKFERDLVAMELKEHTEPMMDVDVPNTAPTSTTAYHNGAVSSGKSTEESPVVEQNGAKRRKLEAPASESKESSVWSTSSL